MRAIHRQRLGHAAFAGKAGSYRAIHRQRLGHAAFAGKAGTYTSVGVASTHGSPAHRLLGAQRRKKYSSTPPNTLIAAIDIEPVPATRARPSRAP